MKSWQKLFVLFFIISLAFFVQAKSFSFEKVFLDYKIQENGLISVQEQMTIEFIGDFSKGFREIILDSSKGEKIENVLVTIENKIVQHEESQNGNIFRIDFPMKAKNETKQINIQYELQKGITLYKDYGEFFWKVWGDQWPTSVKNLEGRIQFPKKVKSPKDVYSWGHPKYQNSKIGVEQGNNALVFQVFNVPSHQFVEIRMLLPEKQFSKTGEFLNIKNEIALERIIEEESRPTLEEYNPYTTIMNFILPALNILTPILLALIFFGLWHFYGREPKIEYNGLYERDIPYNYSPAVVSALMHQDKKEPENKVFLGTILNLCLKGFFKLQKYKPKKMLGFIGKNEDYKIILQEKAKKQEEINKLTKEEKIVFNFIKNKTSFQEIENYFKNNSYSTQGLFKGWRKSVKEEAEKQEFFAKTKYPKLFKRIFIVGFLITFITPGIGLFLIIIEAFLFFRLFKDALPNRTKKGAEHYAKWIALKKFLEDFSQLKRMPPDAIILWEKFLVYAIPLGVADKVQKAMNIAFKEYNQTIHSNIFVAGTYSSIGLNSIVTSLNASFSSAVETSISSSGSSGFSGGGFSGGGGGGGGGGFS